MAGVTQNTTANTKVVIGNANLVQGEIQLLIGAGKTITTITQVKASVWLIVFA